MELVNDLLNRGGYLEIINKILEQAHRGKGSMSFAIEGVWGSGKTWILKNLKDKIEAKNNDFWVFDFNAWENDFYDEPLIAILAVMVEQLNRINQLNNFVKGLAKESIHFLINALGDLTEKFVGINPTKIYKEVRRLTKKGAINQDFDDKVIFKKVIAEIRDSLKGIANNRGVTLVFLVDELDRCLPAYAIKVLERLHHVFNDLDNSVVILSIDKNQLDNSIENIFGNKVNVTHYLNKFIDFSLKLDLGNLDEKLFFKYFKEYEALFERIEDNVFSNLDIFNNFFQDIPMRSRFKIVEKAKLTHNLFLENKFKKLPNYYLYVELFIQLLEYFESADPDNFTLFINNINNLFINNGSKYINVNKGTNPTLVWLQDFIFSNIGSYCIDIQRRKVITKDGITRKTYKISDIFPLLFITFGLIYNKDIVAGSGYEEDSIIIRKLLGCYKIIY